MVDTTSTLNTMINNNSMTSLSRRVSFPKSDDELVTGYLEPANPWEHVCIIKSIPEIAELYMTSCEKHNTEPLPCVLDHLKLVDLQNHLRQPLLSLKSIKLAPSDCEALEEIFKRIQYKTIDFSNCGLNETAVSALFEIIEYYEATNELDISSNARGMTHRGWASCNYMIGHSQELLVLNADGNPISKVSADNLGSALCTSNLHTLKLEHCGLHGLPLFNLCFKLRNNRILKELWLGHNDLDCHDADTIADLLKANHYLELIDISNNDIRDEGVRHIVTALIMQSKELERRRTLQRAFATDKYDNDNDENFSSVDITSSVLSTSRKPIEWNTNSSDSLENRDEFENVTSKESRKDKEEEIKLGLLEKETDLRIKKPQEEYDANFQKIDVDITTNTSNIYTSDTIQSKSVKSVRNNQIMGQSMLDKLLSMNNISTSEGSTNSFQPISNMAEETNLINDSTIHSTSFSSENRISNLNSKIVTNDRQEEQREGQLHTNLSLSSTKVIPTVQSPTSTLDTLHESMAKKMANLSDITKKVDSSPNLSSNESNTLIINNNNSNINCSKNELNIELSTNETPSSHHLDSQVKIVQVSEETKDNSLLYSDSSKIEAQEMNCCAKIVDVNKSTKLGEDFDDSHSTDSAFESASEGDISRHLPEELIRLSDSLDTAKYDNCNKDFVNQTMTPISSSLNLYNNSEFVISPAPNTAPISGSASQVFFGNLPSSNDFISNATVIENNSCLFDSSRGLSSASSLGIPALGAVYIEPNATLTPTTLNCCSKVPANKNIKDGMAHCRLEVKCRSDNVFAAMGNSTLTNSGCNTVQRRTESSCTFLTESSRTYSQSTDSLCSDNSLDGSTGSADLSYTTSSQLNEKLTKNDTLTRQQRQVNTNTERFHRIPCGLRVLSIWNNNLTKESAILISDLLSETVSLELLNIGKNCLSNDFLTIIKDNLTKNTTLNTIGLQSAHLSSKGIETLAAILNFGGNNFLQRIDIRDNIVEVESLLTLAEVLKSNTVITQIDIDDEPKRLSIGSEAHLEYSRVLENVRSMCLRNEKAQTVAQTEKSTINVAHKKRTSYYMGSRKISLTCHGRPVVDKVNKNADKMQHYQSSNKLEVKRKSGTRLRSPVPSPPSISPSSSPNRTSRFQVFRVAEIGSSTSWKTAPSSNVKMVSECTSITSTGITNTLPLSSSLPSIAFASSTQSIKRLGESPRSRFHVKRIYEDSVVPLDLWPISSSTTMPSISTMYNRSIDHCMNNPISNNGDQIQETIKDSTNADTVPLSTDSHLPSCSLLKMESSVADNANDVSLNTLLHDQKTSIATICKDTMQLHDNNKRADKAPPNVCLTPISTDTPSKKPLSHLRYSLPTSLPLLSPTTSLSSLSSNDDNEASSQVPAECDNLLDTATVGQCPLAIFSENDITLTKNTLTNFKVSTKEITIPKGKCEALSPINCYTILNNANENVMPASSLEAQQRTRKISLISTNVTAVDKLLTLFHHPETIFQRDNSAPASTKTTTVTAATAISISTSASALASTLPSKPEAEYETASEAESEIKNEKLNQLAQENELTKSNQTILRRDDQQNNYTKQKLFKLSSPPSLATLCDNNLNTTAITAAAAAAAFAATIYKDNSIIVSSNEFVERSKQSFLKAASKQLRDFSKHVINKNPNIVNLPQQIIDANSSYHHQNRHVAFSISSDQAEDIKKEQQAPYDVQESALGCKIDLIIPTDVQTKETASEPELARKNFISDDEKKGEDEKGNTVEISSMAASTICEKAITIAAEIEPTTAAAETLAAITKYEINESFSPVNVNASIKDDNDIKEE